MNVSETFTNILKYYVLQTTANKFCKVYVVSNYLKNGGKITLYFRINDWKKKRECVALLLSIANLEKNSILATLQ